MRCPVLLPFALLVLAPYAAWPQDNPVGPEFRVNTYTTERQQSASVAADGSGNFVVVWQGESQDGSSYGVFGQRYTNSGAALGPEFPVNTYTTDVQYRPAIAVDAAGNFVVVWESRYQDGSERGVFGQRYSSSGAPLGPEFQVNSYTTGSQSYPQVAIDSSGNFVVVWHSQPRDILSRDIFGQRYAASGVPLGSEFRVNTYTTYIQEWPSVAADSSGNFVVTWLDAGPAGSPNCCVHAQRYSNSGSPLGPEFRVNNGGGPGVVAVDGSGNFIVAWNSADEDEAGVFAQRYSSSGAPLGTEFRVNSYTPGFQWDPMIAADARGNFVIVWDDFLFFGDEDDTIWGQLFASSGSPIGPDFRVNTYTTNFQRVSAVAADASGHFVVVWNSYTQDGSDYGVFGQRFDSMTVPVELMHFRVE